MLQLPLPTPIQKQTNLLQSKQGILTDGEVSTRRSTVLSLPLQLDFPGQKYTSKKLMIMNTCVRVFKKIVWGALTLDTTTQ